MPTHNVQNRPLNPTDSQRYEMLKSALKVSGRPEDFRCIIGLLSPPPDITNYAPLNTLKGLKIGIVGGGLAGLSAAFELRKLGADITIFDALEDRIGGRVYTYYFDQDKKYYGEMGPMRVPISHETTWHYINKFKLKTNPFIQQNPNAFLYVHNTRVRNDSDGSSIEESLYPKYKLTPLERNTPWPELYDYAINYPLKSMSPQLRTEILQILPRYTPPYEQYINMSFRQVFERLGLSQDAIDLISSVDPLTGRFLYISYSELLQEMYPVDFADPYYIQGGMVNLPLAFYRSLMSLHPEEYDSIPDYFLGNVAYKSGHFVTGISKHTNNRKVILRYRSIHTSQDMTDEFDYVICAIPFSTLREIEIKPLFSNRKMQAIRELNYMSLQKTAFLCDTRFWEENAEYGHINGGLSFTDLPINTVVYPSDHAAASDSTQYSPHEPGVILASYNANSDAVRLGNLNEQRRIEVIKRNVEEVHGLPIGYLDSIVKDYKTVYWDREQWFRGGVAMTYPEQKNIFSYSVLMPEYNDRVFFAGEHVSATHGWMQGALYTGKLAANMLACRSRLDSF